MNVTHYVQPANLWHRLRGLLSQAGAYAVLTVGSVLAIVPFFWMVFASFRPFRELVESRDFFPHQWTLANYMAIITRVNFLSAFRNSLVIAVVVTFSTLLTSAYLGYVFAKYEFRGKEAIFTLLLMTMMVPFAVVLVPLYLVISDLGWVNQHQGIIVTGLWSTFGIFLMRQFIEGLPEELLDAARIDGASEWRIFFRLVVPLSMAPLSALGILTFLGSWDNFMWPSIVLNSPAKQTLPLLLAGLKSLYWTRYDLWAAGSMLTVLPVMILYLFASKNFIQGLAMTGLKA